MGWLDACSTPTPFLIPSRLRASGQGALRLSVQSRGIEGAIDSMALLFFGLHVSQGCDSHYLGHSGDFPGKPRAVIITLAKVSSVVSKRRAVPGENSALQSREVFVTPLNSARVLTLEARAPMLDICMPPPALHRFARWFTSLTIVARLCVALAFVYVLGAAVGVTGIASSAFVGHTSEHLYDTDIAGALVAEEAQSAIAETSRAQLSLTTATSGDEREVAKTEMLSGLRALDVLLGDTRLIANNAVVEARIQYKKAQEMSLAYIELVQKQPLNSIYFATSVSVDGRFLAEQMQQLTKAVRQLKEQQLTQARATMTSALESQRTAQFLMAGLLGLSLIAAIVMAYMFSRYVRSELGHEPANGSTQENSTLVARAAAASALHEQAEDLALDVRAFKLDEASDSSFAQSRFDKPDSSMPVLA
jgi:hypothetical protein